MAERDAPEEPPTQDREQLEEESQPTVDWVEDHASFIGDDPVARALDTQWKDRQQHGRLAYEMMMRHQAVRTPFEFWLAFLKSIDVSFSAPQDDPSEKQQELAAFANAQLKRVGWTSFVDGLVGNGLEFGFGLAEMSTTVERWRDRPFVQIDDVNVLPQASLDDAMQPREDLNELAGIQTPSYNCFDYDDRGNVVAVKQYATSTNNDTVEWSTPQERLRILHFKHKGGDGNPFGEPLLFTAFYHWADLYMLDRREQIFLENAFPYITARYNSDSGESRQELNKRLTTLISEQDPARRLLAGPVEEFGKVTASDAEFAEHIERRKRELRTAISHSMLVPMGMYHSQQGADIDTREMVQLFLKFTLPSILNEIADMMEDQFAKRLIDSNYSNVQPDDYPEFKHRLFLSNDRRIVLPFLQRVLPHVDSDRLGEMLEDMLPRFEEEWIADTHEDSVAVQRPEPEDNPNLPVDLDPPEGSDQPGTPSPDGEEGENQRRDDGETQPVGQNVQTTATYPEDYDYYGTNGDEEGD